MANTDKRIIYTDNEGQLVIMCPANNCGLTVEEIQAKDVPTGISTSHIIDATDLPSDTDFIDIFNKSVQKKITDNICAKIRKC